MILTISWGAIAKISILGAILMVIKGFLRCAHDKYCVICKTKDSCCK